MAKIITVTNTMITISGLEEEKIEILKRFGGEVVTLGSLTTIIPPLADTRRSFYMSLGAALKH